VSFCPPQIPHALKVIQTGAVAEFKHEFCLRNIQGVSGKIVNILGGGSMDYSEQIISYKHVSNFQWLRKYSCLNLARTDPMFVCGDG
jgi:hypothetical protein